MHAQSVSHLMQSNAPLTLYYVYKFYSPPVPDQVMKASLLKEAKLEGADLGRRRFRAGGGTVLLVVHSMAFVLGRPPSLRESLRSLEASPLHLFQGF